MKNSLWVPQKIKNGIIIWSSNPTFYTSKITQSNITKIFYKDPYLQYYKAILRRPITPIFVTCGVFFHNSQEVEATHISINKWMDKENIVYNTTEYCAALKRRTSVTCYNMNEFQENLKKISQSPEDNYCLPLIWCI